MDTSLLNSVTLKIMKIYPSGMVQIDGSFSLFKEKYKITKTALKGWKRKERPTECQLFPLHLDPPIYSCDPCSIVYEDEAALVAYKPAYLLIHSDGSNQISLQDQVNSYLALQSFPFKAQAVHRLDYETCGLVLFCKVPFLQNYFDAQFRDHTILKEYYCIIDSSVDWKSKEIKANIGKDRHQANKMILYPKGKEAKTTFYKIKEKKGRTLLKAVLEHGRKHQIRLHTTALHTSILNDSLYGHKTDGPLCLECFHLVFDTCPAKEKIDIQVDLDPNLAKFL